MSTLFHLFYPNILAKKAAAFLVKMQPQFL